MYKAALTKMSGSGHPTGSPLKVKKVWIWQLGGRQFRYLVRYFESSPVHAIFFDESLITFLKNWEMKWGKSLYDKYFF